MKPTSKRKIEFNAKGDEIMAIVRSDLTNDEFSFLVEHKIHWENLFDARGLPPSGWDDSAKKLGLDFDKREVFKKKLKEQIKIKKCNKDIFYIYNLSSDIWYLAGDQSTDYNFYTKRIILATILSKLYLKILNSKNYNKDKLIVDIENELIKVGKFNKFKSQLSTIFNNIRNQNKNKKNFERGY